MKYKLFIPAVIVFSLLFSVSCGKETDTQRINRIAQPYTFSLVGWEASTLIGQIKDSLTGADNNPDPAAVDRYFSSSNSQQLSTLDDNSANSGLETSTETIIERQIRDILTEEGVFNPYDNSLPDISFPPVNFKLQELPNLLVISPRDRIETMQSIMMLPDMTVAEMENVENQISELGYSALITPIGGLGATFPTLVAAGSGLKFTLEAAGEEWAHQYLAFKPLGFSYVLHLLGLKMDYDIVSVNETVASMTGKEIAAKVLAKYYPDYQEESNTGDSTRNNEFNQEMRRIRVKVDALLSDGQVEAAEQFMVESRDYMESKGYYIRKLNQAYFAFYGSYADSPTSVSPIGGEVRAVRDASPSLGAFLHKVSGITQLSQLEAMSGN